MDLSSKNQLPEINFIFLALIIFIAIFAFFPIKIISFYFLFLVFFITALFLLNNKIGFFLLILIRPLLDALANQNILLVNNFAFNAAAIFAIISIALTILVCVKNKKIILRLKLAYFWYLFLGVTLLSIIFSFDKVISLTEWTRLLSIYSFLILGLFLIRNHKDFFQLLKVIVYSVLIPSFFALFQYITASGITIPLEGITNRIYGTFVHPNSLAYYLVLVLSLLTYLIIVKKNIFSNSILFIFYLTILTLTFTRGAWLAIVLVFFIIGIIKYRKMLIIFLMILFSIYILIEPIRVRINAFREYNPDSSIEWRKGIWNDGLSIAKEKMVLGHGTGTASKILLETRGEKAGSPDPHNDYLKLFIENGMFGALSYILIILALLHNLVKKYFSAKNLYQKNLYLVLFSLSIAIFTMSFIDNIIRNTVLQWTFWAIIGGSLIFYKNSRKTVE